MHQLQFILDGGTLQSRQPSLTLIQGCHPEAMYGTHIWQARTAPSHRGPGYLSCQGTCRLVDHTHPSWCQVYLLYDGQLAIVLLAQCCQLLLELPFLMLRVKDLAAQLRNLQRPWKNGKSRHSTQQQALKLLEHEESPGTALREPLRADERQGSRAHSGTSRQLYLNAGSSYSKKNMGGAPV